MTEHFPLKGETHAILGACFEVYNELGCGFLESVYQECLELEMSHRNIPYQAQKALHLRYKGKELSKTYAADLVCFESIVVEIKAVTYLVGEHRAQVLNYLHATALDVGLLVNFGHYPKLEYERFISRRLSDPGVLV